MLSFNFHFLYDLIDFLKSGFIDLRKQIFVKMLNKNFIKNHDKLQTELNFFVAIDQWLAKVCNQ